MIICEISLYQIQSGRHSWGMKWCCFLVEGLMFLRTQGGTPVPRSCSRLWFDLLEDVLHQTLDLTFAKHVDFSVGPMLTRMDSMEHHGANLALGSATKTAIFNGFAESGPFFRLTLASHSLAVLEMRCLAWGILWWSATQRVLRFLAWRLSWESVECVVMLGLFSAAALSRQQLSRRLFDASATSCWK